MRIVVVIFCILGISCAIPINELHSESESEANQTPIPVVDGNEESEKRAVRQVAVNVGPVGVGVSPFGGVGVRVGPLFGLNIAPSNSQNLNLIFKIENFLWKICFRLSCSLSSLSCCSSSCISCCGSCRISDISCWIRISKPLSISLLLLNSIISLSCSENKVEIINFVKSFIYLFTQHS